MAFVTFNSNVSSKWQLLMKLGACAVVSTALAACAAPTSEVGGPSRTSASTPAISQPTTPGSEAGDTGAKSATLEGAFRENTADFTIAILLPLSGPNADTGNALLSAASIAVFDGYDPRIALLPYDTQALTAAGAVEQAVADGADIILGPLTSASTRAAGERLRSLFAGSADASSRPDQHSRAPQNTDTRQYAGSDALRTGQPPIMLSFSSNDQAASAGQFILGFRPAVDVARITAFARARGGEAFAGLFPLGPYGDVTADAFADAVFHLGGTLAGFERYNGDTAEYDAPVRRLADYDRRRKDYRDEVAALQALKDDLADNILDSLEGKEVLEGPGFDTILVAEGGERLRAIAPLLPYYEIDPNEVTIIGTGLWDDPSLFREPPLQGAFFAAPNPDAPRAFLARLEALGVTAPPRIATIAYDAAALAAYLFHQKGASIVASDLYRSDAGFAGLDGPIVFEESGLSARRLSVLQINRGKLTLIETADGAAFNTAIKD